MKPSSLVFCVGLLAAVAIGPAPASAREPGGGRGFQQNHAPALGYGPGRGGAWRPPGAGSYRGPRGPGAYGDGYSPGYDNPARAPRPAPFRAPQGLAPGFGPGFPRTYAAPGGYGRGAFLPPGFGAAAVGDPRAYHLRRPPNGYVWVLMGPNAYLAQRSTGLILDTAPLY